MNTRDHARFSRIKARLEAGAPVFMHDIAWAQSMGFILEDTDSPRDDYDADPAYEYEDHSPGYY